MGLKRFESGGLHDLASGSCSSKGVHEREGGFLGPLKELLCQISIVWTDLVLD